jgi:hypothetical protein
VGVSVNFAHKNRLPSPVIRIILNNTQRIDPYKPKTKFEGNPYCFLEGFAEFIIRNFMLKWCVGLLQKLEELESAPTMAQGGVSSILGKIG